MPFHATPKTCWTETVSEDPSYGGEPFWRLDYSMNEPRIVYNVGGGPQFRHALPANWVIFTKVDRDEAHSA